MYIESRKEDRIKFPYGEKPILFVGDFYFKVLDLTSSHARIESNEDEIDRFKLIPKGQKIKGVLKFFHEQIDIYFGVYKINEHFEIVICFNNKLSDKLLSKLKDKYQEDRIYVKLKEIEMQKREVFSLGFFKKH